MGENIVRLLVIYGAWSMLLSFWDNQDTESETWEMKIGVAGPVLTQKKTNVQCSP